MNKVKGGIRVAEIAGLADTLLRTFRADTLAQSDAYLPKLMAELDMLFGNITTAILQDKILSRLDEADSERDEAIRSLFAVVAGYAAMPIEAKKAAALPLKSICDKYAKASITKVGYTSESSMIESLLKDLSAEDLKENIKGLEGVGHAVELIRSTQNAFTQANDAYIKAVENKGKSATNCRKQILSMVNDKIVMYLETMKAVGNESILEFYKVADAEINRMNDAIGKRKKKDDKPDEKSPDSPQ
ncbi:DUF6261 family protein [Fibrobacter intestinalis]|uniref:Uncharacterized protein n=1 Tax=Fibrobacter intestinalis TaxID=28122 RepID=A0A1T4JYX7_9BACT|nr:MULTISPECIES: DUF6261 family protein [Fibrobacter]PBC73651.1 hypothetical protein BGW94_1268 [Fibrobacter sp. NR9]SJZ35373.1 hypothetical protein SAMN02745108_00230 [Fibrobacter intestinalis]